ncbi:MAG: hypothetical protein K2K30_07565 [Alistipes sp.]|nr:hypothetical protein [Alistipes sp.]
MRALLPGLLLLGGSCDRTSRPHFEDPPGQLHSIAYLKSLCTRPSVVLAEDIAVRGRVVSSDRYGEFDRTLVLEDAGGGITVALDCPSTADEYPFGTTLTLYCNGLTLCNYGGKIQIGTAPGDYGAGRIPAEELPARLRREPAAPAPPEAAEISIGELSLRHVDTYVRIEGVRFTTSAAWCDTDPETGRTVATEREVVDATGARLRIRTIGSCTYANEPLPEGTGSLKGIVDYFGGSYSLRIVNRSAEFGQR